MLAPVPCQLPFTYRQRALSCQGSEGTRLFPSLAVVRLAYGYAQRLFRSLRGALPRVALAAVGIAGDARQLAGVAPACTPPPSAFTFVNAPAFTFLYALMPCTYTDVNPSSLLALHP